MQEKLRDYEMVLVLDPTLEESGTEAEVGKCREVIESNGGTLDKVDEWGRRKLAYEIKKRTEGFYLLLEFRAKPGIARELDRELRVRETVLRYLTVLRKPVRPDTPETPPEEPSPETGTTEAASSDANSEDSQET